MGERYTEIQLKEAGLQYFNKDLLATNVWLKKYALKEKNTENYLENNTDETIQRVAHEIQQKLKQARINYLKKVGKNDGQNNG